MLPDALSRYWHTLRWLKPVQLYGRVWFRLWHPRPNLAPARRLRQPDARWMPCARRVSLLSPTRMRFLNVERDLARASDWNHPDWPKLWLYNAHYFDDLVADDAAERSPWHAHLIERWIDDNPPAHGNGWEPYPLSLRIVNWVKWAAAGNALSDGARHSLTVQARYLRRRLEVHLLGNHLWANAKALVFAGAAFEGREGDAWLSKGLALIRRELDEQILADGGHFERSPMYHAIVLEDLLDLIQLASIHPGRVPTTTVDRWRAVAPRMLHWLRLMSHPDGDIAFFNDAAIGIAPPHAALAAYARALELDFEEPALQPIEPLPDSGYVRLEAGPAVLIADVGAIGPDYLPGHAHADTLSFELSLHGRRLLLNAGTSTYAPGPLRAWQRSTAAHNCVQVDGQDSSEVWASFRVARRARARLLDVSELVDGLLLEAEHDGYRRLPGHVLHRRRWLLRPSGLEIRDHLDGDVTRACARYRLTPAAHIDGQHIHTHGHALRWQASRAASNRSSTEAWYPGFGHEQACQVLELDIGAGDNTFKLEWDG